MYDTVKQYVIRKLKSTWIQSILKFICCLGEKKMQPELSEESCRCRAISYYEVSDTTSGTVL